jgi:hypothetical protein
MTGLLPRNPLPLSPSKKTVVMRTGRRFAD